VTPNLTNQLLLAAASLLTVVAIVDASIGRNWDLVVVAALVLVLQMALWLRLAWGRTAVPIRHDLARWLGERAVAGGEPVGRVAERAIGAYRIGLVGIEPDTDDG